MFGLMSNGSLRQANLKMLFERARQYEKASFKGLFNFINFIDKLRKTSGDMSSAKLIGENEDVVRIMSIHKSKGLEFPVVILAGTGKGFNLQDLNDTILMHQDIGFGPKYIDFESRIEYNTLAKEAIRINTYVETLSEEMRILYVALTRAKEKLIITGIKKDAEKSLKEKEDLLELYSNDGGISKINSLLIKKYKTYLDWLELVYLKNKNKIKDVFCIKTYKKDEILKNINKNEQKVKQEQQDFINKVKEKSDSIYNENDEVINKIKWQYKYSNSILIPTKTSVTKIKEIENENIMSLEEKEEIENIKEYKILTSKPKFIDDKEKITSAEKGTLMHLCIQKMNEKENYDIYKIEDMVNELYKKDIITKNQKDVININKLYEYTKSDLWKELRLAKEICKEKPFYINLSSKDIFKLDTSEDILVQGIIDLYYINSNDELILVDFKTDYIKSGEEDSLIKKYNKQLEIYRKALEESLNKNVSHTYIYSVSLNKCIEL